MTRLERKPTNLPAGHVRWFWYLVLLWLSACSGGIDLAEGGIDGSGAGISVGPISNFGSIIVNDIKYDTSQAELFIDGNSAGLEQLRLGMYVDVTGTYTGAENEGAAQRIEYRDTLRGRVEFVSVEGQTLRVLSQVVHITDQTRLYGFATLAELQAGAYVRVSGPLATRRGETTATLVERLPGNFDEAATVGTVSNLDSARQTFFIAGLQVSYADAQTIPPQLRNAMPVAVRGTHPDRLNAVYAVEVRELVLSTLPTGSRVEIAGTVTRFENLQDFDVQLRPVRLPQSLAETLNPTLDVGSQVNLTGFFEADGVITIETFEMLSGGPLSGTPNDLLLRVSGPLFVIDPQTGMLNVAGVTARVDEMTRYYDQSGEKAEFGKADLRLGDILTIAGSLDEQGAFKVLQILYEPFIPEYQRQLQGHVDESDGATRYLRILGIPVSTMPATRYFDASPLADLPLPPPGPLLEVPAETEVDAARFFQRLAEEPDLLVNAFGADNGGGIVAEKLVILPREL